MAIGNITRNTPAGQWGAVGGLLDPLESVSCLQPVKIGVFATSILPTFRAVQITQAPGSPRFRSLTLAEHFFYFLSTSCPARFKVSERSIDSTHLNALLKELSELDRRTHTQTHTRTLENLYLRYPAHTFESAPTAR